MSTIITDEMVDALMDDWFDRDGETYVHKRTTGRLGWEERLEGTSYSSYFLDTTLSEMDVIKRAYSLASETVISMDIPFKVSIKVSSSSDSYTDGKLLHCSTKVFDEPELSLGEKVDVFIGIAVHEAAHLLYTDLSSLGTLPKPIHTIWNIVEDERIERLIGEEKPGLANFLEKVKYYVFDHIYIDTLESMTRELNLYEKAVNLLLKIIRYPKYIEEKDIVEFYDYMVRIKEVTLPYPTNNDDCLELARDIFEIIRDLYIEDERSRGGGGSGEGEPTEEEISRAEERMLEDMGASEETFREILREIKPTKSSKDIDKCGALRDEVSSHIIEGTMEETTKDVVFIKSAEDASTYLASLDRVKRYIPAIAKVIKGHCKEYKLIHRSMRSGVLDTNKLAEAVQGVPSVYIREGEVKTDKVAICVLIDESGSMCGSRMQSARDTAVLINEAVGGVPQVELFIYGHSGDDLRDRTTEIFIYREGRFHPKYALGSSKERCQNRDGTAIYETAKRVRSMTKTPVIMFVISDGAPCAGGYGGDEAVRDVRNKVSLVEKMNFSVIQVCINHVYNPATMFKHYVILENMSTLAIDLGRIIKKAVVDNASVRIS